MGAFSKSTFVRNLIRTHIDIMKLRYAIYLADSKQRAYGKQYFVLPDGNGRLRVLNKDDIKALKKGFVVRRKDSNKCVRVRQMDKRVTHLDIMRECFYFTPYYLGDHASTITATERAKKQREWLEWIKMFRVRQAVRKNNKKQ